MNYCFFTPSYIGDIDRVKLLRQSINKFSKEQLTHYIIVPKEDYRAFKKCFILDKNAIVLRQNDYVSKAFYPSISYQILHKLLPSQSWRLGKYAGRPGWIIQQIVKLCIPQIIIEDAAFVVDSDVFFIRPFSIHEILDNSDKDRILIRISPSDESALQRKHISKSRGLFSLPEGATDFHYMSWPTLLYKDWLQSLQQYLTSKYNKNWQIHLHDANIISEYSIYGIYVEEVARYENYKTITTPLYEGIWSKEDFFNFISGKLLHNPKALCIVIQSNLGIPVKDYMQHVQSYLETPSH